MVTETKEYKGVRQAFGSPGGKSYLAPRIVDLMPPHKIYVEPFVGGGAVFYRKYPSGKEVLNDKDQEIIFADKFMRDMTPEQFERLKKFNWVGSRARFDKVKATQPRTNLQRFYKFYYLKGSSFAQAMQSYNPMVEGKDLSGRLEKLQECHVRLNRVKLSASDYSSMIDKFDSPDTLFYLDPPYPNRTDIGGKNTFCEQFTNDDLQELVGKLDKIKGKFILSLGSESTTAIPEDWHIKKVKVWRRLPKGNQEGRFNKSYQFEILVSKQPLAEHGVYNQYPQTMKFDPSVCITEPRYMGYKKDRRLQKKVVRMKRRRRLAIHKPHSSSLVMSR